MKMLVNKIKPKLMLISYWIFAILIPASILAYGCWKVAVFVNDPVPAYVVPQVMVSGTKHRVMRLYNKEEAIARVKEIAQERKFEYVDYLLRLISCETGGTFDQFALNWKNTNGSLDSGALQINSVHKLGRDKTFDLDFSVNFAIDKINAGGQGIWVCDDLVKSNPDKYRKFFN
jgi:hypothetical protein